MNRAIALLSAALLGGCAVGVPIGKLFAEGVHDYCSHSEEHKMLFWDEVAESLTKYAADNNEPPNTLDAPKCGRIGVNH